ncbi:transcriptional repressor [Kordiimonas sp. SCSIO 12610]|uniref:transcriptional repressor n=1 Tax=Kordiimonas sp. SCSIO 12610 TaxID=2829597 RepID=UPI002109BB49|nr:transcriptional repressor [Kordiimonas sp. SCSIO 12610]UTW56027.1 transcriptional repressor [Kordiimonas sp. SCSIO 12610]
MMNIQETSQFDYEHQHKPEPYVGNCYLTPNEHMVHKALLSVSKAMKAYELLDYLRETEGVRAAPTVYRALNALEEKGLVYRLVSTQQFIARSTVAKTGETCLVLICDRCGSVDMIEDPQIISALDANAAQVKFAVRSRKIEFVTTCRDCK